MSRRSTSFFSTSLSNLSNSQPRNLNLSLSTGAKQVKGDHATDGVAPESCLVGLICAAPSLDSSRCRSRTSERGSRGSWRGVSLVSLSLSTLLFQPLQLSATPPLSTGAKQAKGDHATDGAPAFLPLSHTLPLSTPLAAGAKQAKGDHAVDGAALRDCRAPGLRRVGFSRFPAPYTLHPTPHTLNPAPYTLRPTPYTREYGIFKKVKDRFWPLLSGQIL